MFDNAVIFRPPAFEVLVPVSDLPQSWRGPIPRAEGPQCDSPGGSESASGGPGCDD